MINFDEKCYFTQACHNDPLTPNPYKTMPERVEETARMLRDTLERLKTFEAHLTEKYDNIMSVMTRDNVTFKTMMEQGFSDFISTVKAEVSLFESNIEASIKLFEAGSASSMAEHLAKIEAAEMYMRENLNVTLENLFHDMEEKGELVGVIDSEVFTSVKRHGARGDGETDDTAAIQAAIDSMDRGGTIYFPSGVYMVSSDISVPSFVKLTGERGTSVIKRMPTGATEYNVFIADGVEQVAFHNLKIEGERNQHTGTAGEWGMGIGLYSVNGATVQDCEIVNCWGDGVYIGSNTNYAPCKNVLIANSTIKGNRRNGISVINADGLLIGDCTIQDNTGTSPEYGVCFECNETSECVKNARVVNCHFSGNKYGVGFSGSSNVYEVSVSGCHFEPNNGVYVCRTSLEDVGGFINIQECTFNSKNGVVFDGKTVSGVPVIIDGCKFFCTAIPVRIGYAELNLDGVIGGISITNCEFVRWGSDYYPVMIRSGIHANGSYGEIFIDGRFRPVSHSLIFASASVPGSMEITPHTVPEKNYAENITVNAVGGVFTRANVNLSGGNKEIMLGESFPYGVDVQFRLIGSNANTLTFKCENGIFAQVSDSAHSVTFSGLYTTVTIRHEAPNRWSFRKETNNI